VTAIEVISFKRIAAFNKGRLRRVCLGPGHYSIVPPVYQQSRHRLSAGKPGFYIGRQVTAAGDYARYTSSAVHDISPGDGDALAESEYAGLKRPRFVLGFHRVKDPVDTRHYIGDSAITIEGRHPAEPDFSRFNIKIKLVGSLWRNHKYIPPCKWRELANKGAGILTPSVESEKRGSTVADSILWKLESVVCRGLDLRHVKPLGLLAEKAAAWCCHG